METYVALNTEIVFLLVRQAIRRYTSICIDSTDINRCFIYKLFFNKVIKKMFFLR